MNKKTIGILTLVSIIFSVIITPLVSAEYWTEHTNIEKFLKEDNINKQFNWTKTYSGVYAYYLAKNAFAQNISLGRVYVYNDTYSWRSEGYVFNYYITSEGYYIFIDPQTDKIISWNEANHRFKFMWKPNIIDHVKYYYYYPYIYYEGSGNAPEWLVKSTIHY